VSLQNDPAARSWLHRVPAWAKLSATLALVIYNALLPAVPHPAMFLPLALLAGVWLTARPPLRLMLRRLLVAEFFILGLVLLPLLNPGAATPVAAAIIKSNLCIIALLLLTWSTPFPEILALLRRIHFPAIMLSTLALMVRYLPVLREESHRMQRARSSRTFSRRGRLEWNTLGNIIGQLFIRSANRAERIYLAMCARGWK
jgi:cobalt/nickel transport system permease protein